MDESTTEAVHTLDLRSDDEVLEWWRILRAAYEESGGDPTGMLPLLRAGAASFDEWMVESFAIAVTEGGGELVERLLELEPWLPEVYWSLRAPPVPDAAEEEPWAWVTAPQREVLSGRWGDHWPQQLEVWLTQRWGEGWIAHPAEHRTVWLDDLLPELAPAADLAQAKETATVPEVPEVPVSGEEQDRPASVVHTAPREKTVERVAAERAAVLNEALAEIRAAGVSETDVSAKQIAELLDQAVLARLKNS